MNNKNVNSDVQETYDNLWKNEWHDLHKIGPGVRTRNRILIKLITKYLSYGSVIDVGCGDGSLLINLYDTFKNSFQYDAGDISDEVLRIIEAQKFIRHGFLLDLENKATLSELTYTAVFCSEVLEHLKEWKIAVDNLSDLLEKDGFLFITVPAQMKYWGPHDEFAKHYRRFEIGQIEEYLKTKGYVIKESKCWGWPFYWLYYSYVLNKISPKSVMEEVTSPFKRFSSSILFFLFHFDDLFSTQWGRRLFIVAQKKY